MKYGCRPFMEISISLLNAIQSGNTYQLLSPVDLSEIHTSAERYVIECIQPGPNVYFLHCCTGCKDAMAKCRVVLFHHCIKDYGFWFLR